MKSMNKKGSAITGPLMGAVTAVVLFFIIGFVLSIGGSLVEDLQDGASAQNGESALYNVTADSIGGFSKVSGFQGTIAIVIAAIVIIGVLMSLLGVVLFKRLG